MPRVWLRVVASGCKAKEAQTEGLWEKLAKFGKKPGKI
jgi:hypothetical protein